MKRNLCVVIALMTLICLPISAEDIEVNIDCTLGPVFGTFGEGQVLSGVATFFYDDPIVFDLGDTLTVNILFDQSLQVFDFDAPTDEAFSFGLNIAPGTDLYSGTWISSIEAIGATGDIWGGKITINWIGGGAGFGWGGAGVQVTESQGRFTGIRWTTTLTSANEGVPMTLTAFTGVQMHADGIIVSPKAQPLVIDIKPGSDPNSVNPGSGQKIAVAILTTDIFDALQIDPLTAQFGPLGALESHGRGHVEDVDLDGDMDLVLHFNTQETGIACGDTEATLTGETFGGQAITGTDSIVTVGCR